MLYKRKPRKEYNKNYSKLWRELNPEKRIITQAKNRSKTNSLDFEISLEDIKIPDVCPVLGIPLKIRGNRFWNSPSLDRIDSSKGYTKDNIHIISGRANILKRDASFKELELLVNYLRRFQCVL